MLLQSPDMIRILIIFIPQLVLAGLFLFLGIKLLKRNRQRPTVTLCMLYIISAAGLIFNAMHVVLAAFQPENEVLLLVIYFLTFFPMLFSPVFILTFMLSLLNLGDVFTIKKQLLITLIYGLIIGFIFFTPNGITFSEQSRPIFSWGFLTLVYAALTVFILLPTLWYSRRLTKIFQDKILKRKLVTFLTGVFGMLISIYGTVLYITWQNSFFSSLWSIVTTFIIIPSALFIYYGIGRGL
jgi:Co/Zn/Cd efflux system component